MTDITIGGFIVMRADEGGSPWQYCTCKGGESAGCVVDDAAANGGDGSSVYEYTCLIARPDGSLAAETLGALDAGHAFEEASYECDGTCIAVRRGSYLHDND